jgi:phosphate transport system permease protein
MTEPRSPQAEAMQRRLRRRHRAEVRFRAYGAAAIGVALSALAALLVSVVSGAMPAFWQHEVRLPLHFDAALLDPDGRGAAALPDADYGAVLKEALRERFPEYSSRSERRQLSGLLSVQAPFDLRERLLAEPAQLGRTEEVQLLLSADADLYLKNRRDGDESGGSGLKGPQQAALEAWLAEGRIERVFAWRFLRSGDSREPELAGVWGAAVGSFWTLLITLLLSFPVGAAAALHL